MKPNLTARGIALTAFSAFADYKPCEDSPLANWRAVNDTVASLAGGHAGQLGGKP